MAKKKTIFDNPEALRDIARGIGAGFQAYDPNNPFAGMGAALSATVGSAEERIRRKEDRAAEQSEYDRRFKMQQEAREEETKQAQAFRSKEISEEQEFRKGLTKEEQEFRKGLIKEERESRKQEAEDELDRKLEYVRRSLNMQKEMRGNFNPLFGAFGGIAPSMGKLQSKPPYLLERETNTTPYLLERQ